MPTFNALGQRLRTDDCRDRGKSDSDWSTSHISFLYKLQNLAADWLHPHTDFFSVISFADGPKLRNGPAFSVRQFSVVYCGIGRPLVSGANQIKAIPTI